MFTWWDRMIARLNGDERGQGTVEYFLVILAATALAVVLFRWIQGGGGNDVVGGILGKVVNWILKAF